MRIFLLVSVVLLQFSCNERVVCYEYNNVSVTRIDGSYKTELYYGCLNDELPMSEPSVLIDWSIGRSLSGFLMFKENGVVEVINNGGGIFYNTGHNNSYLKVLDIDNYQYDTLLREYKFSRDNLVFFSNSVEFEEELNSKRKSKVSVSYPGYSGCPE